MGPNKIPSLLQQLFAAASKASAERQELVSEASLANMSFPLIPSAYEALGGTGMSVIAEIKRKSPSKGELAAIPIAAELGVGYQNAGADAISVLTEESGFAGSLYDLSEVSAAVSIPTLRKDFISDRYQILEARVSGAAMVLLIMAGLNDDQYAELFDYAQQLELEVLVETHSAAEIERALKRDAKLLGINTRDLTTFATDRGLFAELAGMLPEDCIKIAESSVRDLADVEEYAAAGANCVLVGEALVTGDYQKLISSFKSVS